MMSRIDRLKREKYVLGNPTEIEKLKKMERVFTIALH